MFGVLCHDILALLHIGCVNNSLLLSGALLLLVELLLCMAGTLLLRHLLHHSIAPGHRGYGALLLMLNHIVCDMLCVADSVRYSKALLAGHNLIFHMAFGSKVTIAFFISIGISISSTSSTTTVPAISWVSICFSIRSSISIGLCLS